MKLSYHVLAECQQKFSHTLYCNVRLLHHQIIYLQITDAPKKLTLHRQEDASIDVIVNRKVKLSTENICSAVAQAWCLHYLLDVNFAALKVWSLVEYVLGLKKKQSLKNVIKNCTNRLNIERGN